MIIDILLPLSLAFIMFTLGLGLTISDFQNVLREPRAFIVGIANQMFILPLVAFIIAIVFSLPDKMAVGIMILACCPGGVTSNVMTRIAKGDTALSISYTAVVSIVSVITLPIIIGFSMPYFMDSGAPSNMLSKMLSVALEMFALTTVPVCIGLYINTKHPNFSNLRLPTLNKISTFLFIVIVAGALAAHWHTFTNYVYKLGPAILTLIIIMLFVGYNSAKLLNINKPKAITISIESGVQNATVGIVVGNIISSVGTGISELSLASGVYGILMYLVCLPCIFIFFKNR